MNATTNRLKIRSQQCRPQQLSRSKKFRQRRNCKRKLWLNTAESQSPRPCPDLRIPSMRNANVISAGHRPRCQQHPAPNNQNYHEHATTSASDQLLGWPYRRITAGLALPQTNCWVPCQLIQPYRRLTAGFPVNSSSPTAE